MSGFPLIAATCQSQRPPRTVERHQHHQTLSLCGPLALRDWSNFLTLLWQTDSRTCEEIWRRRLATDRPRPLNIDDGHGPRRRLWRSGSGYP